MEGVSSVSKFFGTSSGWGSFVMFLGNMVRRCLNFKDEQIKRDVVTEHLFISPIGKR